MYLHAKALSSLLREWLAGSALLLAFLSSLVGGWPLGLTAFSPIRRGTGLPGVEPHWHDPFPDVGWRCGIHPLAHAGEVSQQEELTWNWVSLVSGTAWKLKSKFKSIAMVENSPFISFMFQVKWFGGFVTRQVFCSVCMYVCRGMSG